MLKNKVEEVVSYNSSRIQPPTGSSYRELGESSYMAKKDKKARCYICKEKGHVFSKCTNKSNNKNPETIETSENDTTPIDTPIETPQVETAFKYEPTTVHVSTDYMVLGFGHMG